MFAHSRIGGEGWVGGRQRGAFDQDFCSASARSMRSTFSSSKISARLPSMARRASFDVFELLECAHGVRQRRQGRGFGFLSKFPP